MTTPKVALTEIMKKWPVDFRRVSINLLDITYTHTYRVGTLVRMNRF